MLRSLASILLLGPLAAQAARRRPSCHASVATVVVTHYVTEGHSGPTSTKPVDVSTTLVTIASSVETTTTLAAVSSETTPSAVQSVTEEASSEVSTAPETVSTTVADDSASSVQSSPYADATEVDVDIEPTEQCGNDDRLIMPGMAWTVANSMYNSDGMVGTQCTDFERVLEASDGTYLVEWTSTTNVENIEDTADLCKGYSNIGIGVNLEERLSDVQSIPAYYKWSRTINTEFKGSTIYDFITSAEKGDGTSSNSHEFMLFLKIWGGQVPIGYADGPVNTFDMYGTTWKLYEGINESNGVTVRSMIPDVGYDGEFQGDLKVWLDAMVDAGYIPNSEYVNVGNCGVEVFYGDSTMDATVALDINV